MVAEEVEENTNDFILKTIGRELKGHKLTYFIAHLLNLMGYKTGVAKEGPGGGVDIIAHKDELGFEPPIIKVQVKSVEGSIGDPVVSALYKRILPLKRIYMPQANAAAGRIEKNRTNHDKVTYN
ncbi:MAG: restriction endonuclease [Spirochaetales bacterium]|nr:restriction endonuclease [Spirochaetales bacterium]